MKLNLINQAICELFSCNRAPSEVSSGSYLKRKHVSHILQTVIYNHGQLPSPGNILISTTACFGVCLASLGCQTCRNLRSGGTTCPGRVKGSESKPRGPRSSASPINSRKFTWPYGKKACTAKVSSSKLQIKVRSCTVGVYMRAFCATVHRVLSEMIHLKQPQ